MKRTALFLFLTLSSLVTAQCDSVEAINMEIAALAKAKIGKKVLTGQCWDLAKYVLEETNANWDGMYEYGEKLEKSACLMPGDIIQFKNVKIHYKENRTSYTELMTHHTAIILEVISKDEVVLIHQNTAYSGKKVVTSNLRFSTIEKGKVEIFRPQRN